jgi:group I intron endonuclease
MISLKDMIKFNNYSMVIYCITNKINNKVYIGKTMSKPQYRWNRHIKDATSMKSHAYFHNALRKYGVDNFIFEIIDSALSKEDLNELEKYYISLADSRNSKYGYNLHRGGELGGCKEGYFKGKQLSPEHKKSISDAHKKLTPHPNSIKALKERTHDHKPTKEHLEKLHKSKRKQVIDQFSNIFESATAAAHHYGFNRLSVNQVASGKRASIFDIKFKYL